MKRIYSLLAVLVLLIASDCVSFGATMDSVYLDSLYAGPYPNVITTNNLFGKPDTQFAILTLSGQGAYLYANFHRRTGSAVSSAILPIKPNSTIVVWGKKDASVDTSSATITLGIDDPYFETDPIRLNDGVTVITVPNMEFRYVYLALDGLSDGLGNGAKSFKIDAVMLIEDTAQTNSGAVIGSPINRGGGIVANYPNPFFNTTSVAFTTPNDGAVSLVAVDMQGNEYARADLGMLAAGEHRVGFDLQAHGMYFLRMFVNGIPYGNPIKIISQ